MDWQQMERHFSPARIERYKAARNGDTALAAADYTRNMLLAEAMVPMLNVLEIGLRNALHVRLKQLYGREDWWESWTDQPAFDKLTNAIAEAKRKLRQRRERTSSDKIMAEQHAKGVTLVRWLDPDLADWLARHDRLPGTWQTA